MNQLRGERDDGSGIRSGEAGFTLAELLVTCAILGIIMAATLTAHLTGATVAAVGESKAEAQQGARAAMIMEEDLRLAGYGYPTSPQTTFTAATPTSVTFQADLVNASTQLSQPVNSGDRTLTVVNTSALAPGDTVYLLNGDVWEALTVLLNEGPQRLRVRTGAVNAYPAGTQVGRPRLITYSWSAATQRLSKDAGDGNGLQPFADGIPTFQLQFYDPNDVLIPVANLPTRLGTIRRIAVTMSAQSSVSLAGGAFTVNSSVRPPNL